MASPAGVGNDRPSLAAILADYGRTIVGTVGTILAVLAAYGTWAMNWPLAFLGVGFVGLVAYALQTDGQAGRGVSFDQRLLRSVARIGPYAGLIGLGLSVPAGRPGWAAGFLAGAAASYGLRWHVGTRADAP